MTDLSDPQMGELRPRAASTAEALRRAADRAGLRCRFFVLDARGQPREERDATRWQMWMAHATDRLVQRSEVDVEDAHLVVSTVFTGVDASAGADLPLLWETVVYEAAKPDHVIKQHWPTRAAAVDGHARILRARETERAIRLRD